MKKLNIRKKHGPEYHVQQDVVAFLRQRGWHVERLIGVALQSGLPDLFACHPKFGIRFIELKNEDHYGFTKAQKWKFPVLMQYGLGIWILTAANEEQYDRLFKEPNLWDYLETKDILTRDMLDDMFDELAEES